MNSACLIGLVACLPRPVGDRGDVGFLLLTERDLSGQRVDRHRVILPARHAPDLAEFMPGATVYVEGHLARHGERRRVSVIAHRAWSIAPAPPAPEEDRPVGTHASPREHQRAGYARRVAIATPRERIVWVRPTTVRPHASSTDH
ncbi:MAG: hypothetical protein ACLQGJ_09175 [Candidatus Dormibacteria bacterium]